MMKKFTAILIAFVIAVSTVSVYAEDQAETKAPESIKISVRDAVMEIGSTQRLIISVTPVDASEYSLDYYSDNPDVITAAIGTLIANKEGSANITVKVSGTEISDTISVTVKGTDGDTESPTNPDGDSGEGIKVSSIEPEDDTLYIERYSEEKIYYDILPQNASNKSVMFESLNTSVATVDSKGNVYGKKKGNTRIKITSEDGSAQAYVRVYVTNEDDEDIHDSTLRSITIMYEDKAVKDNFEIMEKETVSFEIKASPSTANKNVTWKSFDEDVATVDSNGRVTGVSTGTCKIQAVSKANSSKKCTVTIKVTEYIRYPDSISIVPAQDAVFETGNTVIFTATFYPEDTTERGLKWYAYGGGTIDQNGRLTVTDGGEIKVRVYSQNYKASAEYVLNAVYSSNYFLTLGEAYNLRNSRKIEIYFDTDVNYISARNNIFASSDPLGNGEKIPIEISTVKNKLVVTAVDGWKSGDTYIFIKGNMTDTDGNRLGKNLKYKINVRGVPNET